MGCGVFFLSTPVRYQHTGDINGFHPELVCGCSPEIIDYHALCRITNTFMFGIEEETPDV